MLTKRLEPAAVLNTETFEVVAVMDGTDRLAFLRHYFWRTPTWITRAHHACSAAILAAAALSGLSLGFGITAWLGTAVAALTAAILLLMPVHEAIHASAYKWLGASDVRWTWSIRNRMASVTAHRFVLARREVMLVAALPWALITLTLGIIAAWFPAQRPFLLIGLLVHHVGSRGDWAYLNYFWRCRGRDLYAFEDADLQQSWLCLARQKDERSGAS